MTDGNGGEDAVATGGFSASNDGWLFAGALTLDDAAGVLEASQALPLPVSGVVDFSGLMHADSAALAVMIALKRRGTEEGRTLAIRNIPPSLRSLAAVYGIDDLLD
ncbi:MAG TPA: STAS domain-containing protein [Casimicrobiaceae bacterium]|nr:STAS domain-containing protein [Casimicrobiaceae bacterium]